MSAVKEFGNAESSIYHLKNSRKHLADLLHLLKIVVHGLAFIGTSEDTVQLEYVKSQLNRFSELVSSIHEHDLILQIRDQVNQACLKMAAGPESGEDGGSRASP
jgi:hypothetical protein